MGPAALFFGGAETCCESYRVLEASPAESPPAADDDDEAQLQWSPQKQLPVGKEAFSRSYYSH